MPAFLIYEVKVAVALALFYMFYRLMLRKETFHRFNRIVLVSSAVLAFLLPLCIVTIHKPMELVQAAESAFKEAEEPVTLKLGPAVEVSAPWWPLALTALFWAGAAFVIIRVAVSILSIFRIVKRGEVVSEEDGCRIIVTDRDIDPFSWMRYIVLSRQDWEGSHESIVAHEKAHIAYGHSVELLVVDLLSALQWFNPAIWMLRADLQELHEYEADDAVLRAGTNIKEYQYLLIRKAVSKSGYSVANSFNHSILKNRITMMSKSKSPLVKGLRVLYLLPLVCLAIGLQARTVYVPADKDSENMGAVQDTLSERISKKTTLNEVTVVKYANPEEEDLIEFFLVDPDTMPSFQGGDANQFAAWVNQRVSYPRDCAHSGTMKVRFAVGSDGSVRDIRVIESVCPELDAAVITVMAQSPKWTPATNNGKPVSYGFTIPFNFVRREVGNAKKSSALALRVLPDGKVENDGKVYTKEQIKEIVPAHKGGEPQATVQIVAADNVPVGVIDDLKMELRKLESLKIRYVREPARDGITRYMPPMPPGGTVRAEIPTEDIKRENLFVVRLNSADKIFFGNKATQDEEEMVKMAKTFLKQHGKDTRFILGADRATSYGAYVRMQELLMRVYSEARNEKALEVYGKPLNELTVEERNQINFQVPIGIGEMELKNGK